MRECPYSTKTREVLKISLDSQDFPIPPEFWWSTDIHSSSIFLQGVDQKIIPCGQGRIDSVKINPSLLMMTDCQILASWDVLFLPFVPNLLHNPCIFHMAKTLADISNDVWYYLKGKSCLLFSFFLKMSIYNAHTFILIDVLQMGFSSNLMIERKFHTSDIIISTVGALSRGAFRGSTVNTPIPCFGTHLQLLATLHLPLSLTD